MFLPESNNILDSTIVDIFLLRKIYLLTEQLKSDKVLCGITTGQLDEKKMPCHGECLA